MDYETAVYIYNYVIVRDLSPNDVWEIHAYNMRAWTLTNL